MKKRLMTAIVAIGLSVASFSAMADYYRIDHDGQIWRCRIELVNPADPPNSPTKETCWRVDAMEPIDP